MTEHPIVKPRTKEMLYIAQDGECAYCGKRVRLRNMTIDHAIPLSRGGTDGMENMRISCKMCNRLKGDMLPDEFTRFVCRILEGSMRVEEEIREGGRT